MVLSQIGLYQPVQTGCGDSSQNCADLCELMVIAGWILPLLSKCCIWWKKWQWRVLFYFFSLFLPPWLLGRVTWGPPRLTSPCLRGTSKPSPPASQTLTALAWPGRGERWPTSSASSPCASPGRTNACRGVRCALVARHLTWHPTQQS